jgi:hypothetical protein
VLLRYESPLPLPQEKLTKQKIRKSNKEREQTVYLLTEAGSKVYLLFEFP